MIKGQTILVLSPHTDDAELGCGATIARLTEQKNDVFIAIFSDAKDSVPSSWPPHTLRRECKAALPKLGVSPQRIQFFDYRVRHFSSSRQDVLGDLI